MYAGKIWLVGTEAGVGVRNAGVISASAGGLVLQSNGWLTNSGTLQGQGDTTVTSTGVRNNGQVNAGQTLAIATPGALDNTGGALLGQRLEVSAAGLLNRGGTIAQTGSQALVVQSGRLSNADGGLIGRPDVAQPGSTTSLAPSTGTAPPATTSPATGAGSPATASATLTAPAVPLADGGFSIAGLLDNDAGSITAAGASDLTVHSGLANNGGSLNLRRLEVLGGDIANRGGRVSTSGALRLQAATLDNRDGELTAGGALVISSGQLQNVSGLVAANGAVRIDASLADNTGGTIASVKDRLDIRTAGALVNDAGHLQAAGDVVLASAQLGNAGGSIAAQSGVNIAASGFGNRGGQVQALGEVAIDVGAGVLDNDAGLIRGAGAVRLSAGTLLNTHTLGAQQGIEGDALALRAGRIANDAGALRADTDVWLASTGLVSNDGGLISAGRAGLVDAGAFSNTGGTVISGQLTRLTARRAGGDGRLLSQGDLELQLSGDFSNTGDVTANGNARITVAGRLANSAKLQAGGTLAVSASDIDNTAGGELSGATTRLSATGTLTNRGLIDGRLTRIEAAVVDNLGTGRIYGDQVGIAAGSVNNGAETIAGITAAGTIAARQRLDIGASSVYNSAGALLLSGGDLAIGGALDVNGHAIGEAGLIRNAAATIESLGAMRLAAVRIQNANPTFSYRLDPTAPIGKTDYIASDGTAYASDAFGWDTRIRLVDAYAVQIGIISTGFFQPVIGAQRAGSPYADPVYKAYYDGPEAFVAAHMDSTGNGDGEMAFYVPDAGRGAVSITAYNMDNLGGRISGRDVDVQALNDVNNIGGTLGASHQLDVRAVHDLNVRSTTTSGAGSSGASTSTGSGIDRTAGLYVTDTGGVLTAGAGHDVNITGAAVQSQGSRALGSSLGGSTVYIDAGHDITVTGSSVVSDNGTTLVAKNNITVQNATNTDSQGSFSAHRESGLGLDGGLAIGTQQSSIDQQSRRSTAAASTVGSVNGDVSRQDTSSYSSEQKSSSASINVSPSGMPVGGGISVGKSNISSNSNYKSVTEQTGIRAGDGGFDVDAKVKPSRSAR
ncbi:MAG: hypothetical protein EOO28_19875 [Comamonadaceae bacterium]|nr:MAG: hypothetical protein EOO28_19875 [Comamonadaceae bacterium]